METVLDSATESVTDAGELVLDALLGSEDAAGGGRLRRVVFALLLLGGVIGIVLWRRSQASRGSEAGAPA
jgi:hypothetical protein